MITMYYLIVIFLGVIGAAMGSFAGATVWRMHKKMDFLKDRSECEHCHHKLSVLDLVPVFSWLFLRGRCRYCHKKIGVMTLLLEIATAAIFILSFIFWPLGQLYVGSGTFDTLQAIAFTIWLAMVVFMVMLLAYDYQWKLLPNRLMFPLIGITIIFSLLNNIFIQNITLLNSIYLMVLGLIPITGVYGLIYMFSNGRLIGFGDVKFGIVAGMLLGWQGALFVLVIANLLGSLITLPMLLCGKMKMDSQMAFGPFLIAATLAVFLFQESLMQFATNNLLLR